MKLVSVRNRDMGNTCAAAWVLPLLISFQDRQLAILAIDAFNASRFTKLTWLREVDNTTTDSVKQGNQNVLYSTLHSTRTHLHLSLQYYPRHQQMSALNPATVLHGLKSNYQLLSAQVIQSNLTSTAQVINTTGGLRWNVLRSLKK